jgi:hypothetical protein
MSIKSMSLNERKLTELFSKLGADEPESWAHSQITEGIPQLPRYLFLRQAWRNVVSPDDQSWMSKMRPSDPLEPGGEIGPAIDRILAAGARPEDLTTVVRIMQWYMLSRLCVLLDDPGGDVESEVADIWWQLYLIDENDNPVVPISGLIESVLETDPTGREMRPAEYLQNQPTDGSFG